MPNLYSCDSYFSYLIIDSIRAIYMKFFNNCSNHNDNVIFCRMLQKYQNHLRPMVITRQDSWIDNTWLLLLRGLWREITV